MSFDTPADNQNWAEAQNFQYELWSDFAKTLAIFYGAAASQSTTMPSRITKLLDADGTLILEYLSVSVSVHPAEVLADCQTIFGP